MGLGLFLLILFMQVELHGVWPCSCSSCSLQVEIGLLSPGLFLLILFTTSGEMITGPGHVMVTQITFELSEGSFTHERDLQKVGITCRLSSGHPGVKVDRLW